MKIKQFFILFVFIGVTGCGTTNVNKLVAQKGGEQLSPAEVLSLVEGNTLKLTNFDTDAYLYMDRSGRIYAIDDYHNKDLGQWDVSEQGEFCIRMQSWWYSDLSCYMVYRVGDDYKLTTDDGLIKFSAIQYPGDYKSSYYAVNKDKKSYRKSLRTGGEVTEVEKPTVLDTTPEPVPEPAAIAITEENTYKVSQEDKNLRSTVQWMARDCPGCNLSETDLKKSDLVGAKLAGANLSGSNLRMSNMRRADLEGANLEDAILTYCNMPGANLKNANLKGANLKGANLIRADLTGADISGANFEGALLDGVKGMKK